MASSCPVSKARDNGGQKTHLSLSAVTASWPGAVRYLFSVVFFQSFLTYSLRDEWFYLLDSKRNVDGLFV